MTAVQLASPEQAASLPPFVGASLPPSRLRALLIGLGLATGMEFYTFDSVNLVLVDLTGSLGVSGDEASWILTVYSSALFLAVPLSIWGAGHFGYKRFMLATTAAFAVASIGCAVAPDLRSMLLWRAFQGLSGAGLVVWWRASVYLLMPRPARSASLMKVSTMLYLSSAAGLLLSGYLTDHFHWRFIFFPSVLYAMGAIWLLIRHFPDVPIDPSPRLSQTDWPGIGLLAIALVCLQIILSRGEIDAWFGSRRIQVLTGISICSFLAFVAWQAHSKNSTPLLRLDLLRDRFVMSSALIGIFTGAILSGSLFVLPEFLRNVASQPLSATQTGRFMCIYAITAALVRALVIPAIAYLGQRKVIILALTLLISSMALLSHFLTAGTPDNLYIVPLVLYGLCLSALLPAVGSGTVAKIEQRKLLDGVSLYMTFRQFGASLGVAVLTILLSHRETLHSERLLEHIRPERDITRQWLQEASAIAVSRGGYSNFEARDVGTGLLTKAAVRQAQVLSYADAFAFMAIIGAIALCLVPIIPPTPARKK